ncbi:hypothetical protein V5799_011390 [Amblyomma americanum]|uniref:Uncharacterized protein n=1 Tax=Amblyomma americanum TaxID=6943 RepID=A0AAQ4EH30_AMBAM
MWYVVQRTASLYNDSLSCTSYNVRHKDGVVYEVELDYMDKITLLYLALFMIACSPGRKSMVKKILRIVEDSDHPAQFYFADQDDQRVATSFLGTDYKNWNVVYGYIFGGVPAYGVGSRTPVLDLKYLEEANQVLKKNDVYGTMQNCPPRQTK